MAAPEDVRSTRWLRRTILLAIGAAAAALGALLMTAGAASAKPFTIPGIGTIEIPDTFSEPTITAPKFHIAPGTLEIPRPAVQAHAPVLAEMTFGAIPAIGRPAPLVAVDEELAEVPGTERPRDPNAQQPSVTAPEAGTPSGAPKSEQGTATDSNTGSEPATPGDTGTESNPAPSGNGPATPGATGTESNSAPASNGPAAPGTAGTESNPAPKTEPRSNPAPSNTAPESAPQSNQSGANGVEPNPVPRSEQLPGGATTPAPGEGAGTSPDAQQHAIPGAPTIDLGFLPELPAPLGIGPDAKTAPQQSAPTAPHIEFDLLPELSKILPFGDNAFEGVPGFDLGTGRPGEQSAPSGHAPQSPTASTPAVSTNASTPGLVDLSTSDATAPEFGVTLANGDSSSRTASFVPNAENFPQIARALTMPNAFEPAVTPDRRGQLVPRGTAATPVAATASDTPPNRGAPVREAITVGALPAIGFDGITLDPARLSAAFGISPTMLQFSPEMWNLTPLGAAPVAPWLERPNPTPAIESLTPRAEFQFAPWIDNTPAAAHSVPVSPADPGSTPASSTFPDVLFSIPANFFGATVPPTVFRSHPALPQMFAAPKKTSGEVAVEAARGKLGTNYSAGSTGPDAFDCSGLVQWSYNQAGVDLPRTSYDQLASGTPVSHDDLRPGDVVSYYGGGHSALYAGGGKVIHAATYGVGVTESDLDSMPFEGARRY